MNCNCDISNAIHPQICGQASDVANPVTHSARDFFWGAVKVDKLCRFSWPRSVPTNWVLWPTTRLCYVQQQKLDLLEQSHTWLGMRNLLCRCENPCRGIFPCLFYQSHAQKLFLNAEVFLDWTLISTPATLLTTTRSLLRVKWPQTWTLRQAGLKIKVINTRETKAQQKKSMSGQKKIWSR